MIMDLLKRLNEEGTTIIQVTHNDNWAAYGNRIIQLADGWIVDGQSAASAEQASSESPELTRAAHPLRPRVYFLSDRLNMQPKFPVLLILHILITVID